MRQFSESPLRKVLETVFTSESGNIKQFSKKFVSERSYLGIMDIWWTTSGGLKNHTFAEWVVEKQHPHVQRRPAG